MAKTLNKKEIAKALSRKVGLTNAASYRTLNALLDIVSDSLKSHETVQFTGFGAFKAILRKSRQGRNPQTGEKLTIPAHWAPVFRPGKNLKNEFKK